MNIKEEKSIYGESTMDFPVKFFFTFCTTDQIIYFLKEYEFTRDSLIEKSGSQDAQPSWETVLKWRLNIQIRKSKKLIQQKFESLDYDKGRIESFFRAIFSDLTYGISSAKSNDLFTKEPIVFITIYQLVVYIFNRYNAFLTTSEFHIHSESIQYLANLKKESNQRVPPSKIAGYSQNRQMDNAGTEISGFKWICDKIIKNEKTERILNDKYIDTKTLLLYRILTNYQVIPKDKSTKENFISVFDETLFTEPLKIRWLLTKNKHPKPVITYIIKITLMKKLKLLEDIEDLSLLAKKLEFIFVDHMGNPIRNFYQTLDSIKDETYEKEMSKKSKISILIEEIKNALTSKTEVDDMTQP